MKWHEVREHFPDEWVLVEAIQAHSKENRRIADDLSVINTFPDGMTGFQAYRELHRQEPFREFYVVHTSREELDIRERIRLGIRRAI